MYEPMQGNEGVATFFFCEHVCCGYSDVNLLWAFSPTLLQLGNGVKLNLLITARGLSMSFPPRDVSVT